MVIPVDPPVIPVYPLMDRKTDRHGDSSRPPLTLLRERYRKV